MRRRSTRLDRRVTQGGYEVHVVAPCPECGSNSWEGYQRCTLCYGFFPHGRCSECGHMRLKWCVRDDEPLEFYDTVWKSSKSEDLPPSLRE